MPLDPSIILGIQAPQIDNPLDVQNKALTMRHLTNLNRVQDQGIADDQAMRSAFANNVSPGPDGQPTVDRAGVLSDLARTAPLKAIDQQKAFSAQDLQMQEQKMKTLSGQLNTGKTILAQVPTDPNTPMEQKQAAWTKMKAQGAQYGLPNNDNLPDQYPGDSFVRNMQVHLLTAEEQMAQQNKDREFGQKSTELDYKHEENQIKRQQMGVDRDNKDAEALDKHLSQGWAGRSGQAGAVQGKIVSAQAAQALIDQGQTQKGGLDSRQIEELAQSTAKLLGGGPQASARVDALVPHTLMGKAQTLQEYLTNNPTGANQQAFVQRMADTVAREKALAETQMKQFQVEGLAAHARLQKSNPALYNHILQSKGIDPSMIDDKGQYKAPTPQVAEHPQDDQAVQWAKQNPKDPRAAAILKLNGADQ